MALSPPQKFFSIRVELVVMTTLLVLVMSGTMGLTVAWIYSRHLETSQVAAAVSLARSAALTLALDRNWSDFPWPLLAQNAREADLKLLLAADYRGRPLYRRPEGVTPRDETTLRAALASGGMEVSFDGRRFTVAAPVVVSGQAAGAVCFQGYPSGLAAAGRAARNWMLAALGINILLMGLFLIFFLGQRLVTPIRVLARDLEALGRDRFEPRQRPRASGEVGELFQAFDQAALELMDSRRRLEEQLRTISQTQDRLVASEKMAAVGRLASGLAHELGNPIGALTGFVHLLGQENLSPEDKQLILEQSAQELKRMDGSLKELLHFSRPSRRELEPVSAALVAEAALSLARPQKWAAGTEFRLDNRGPDNPPVLAERNGLLQILLNLLANAGQAGSPQVTLAIDPADDSGRVRLTVTDNGPGVDPADAPNLFEPYFSRKAPGQGTGLGLAVSQAIAGEFGARLEYAPAEGGGAIFSLSLAAAGRESV